MSEVYPLRPRPIDRAQLGALTRIGRGGQAMVFLAERGKTSFAPSIVYKEYKAATLPGVDFAALAAMSALVEKELPNSDAQRLISLAAWPCAVVDTAGKPTGFVMPAIPDRFSLTIDTVKGRWLSSDRCQLNHREGNGA